MTTGGRTMGGIGRRPLAACFAVIPAGAVMLAFAAGAATAAGAEIVPPLGHPDFLPTPTRPVGYLGDGSGQFPGATPAVEWDHGTGTNIIWKAELPYYSSAGGCIVVGDRTFTLAERCWLFCHDAATGKELWRRAVVPQAMLLDEKEGAALVGYLQKHAETLGDYCLCDEVFEKRGKRGSQPGPFQFFQEQLGGEDKPFNAWIERMKKLSTTPLHKQEDLLIVNMAEGHSYYTVSQMEALSLAMLGAGWRNFHSFFEGRNTAIWTASTFVPPVSDGTHVYVRIGGAAVACYDLDGVRRWITWLDDSSGGATAPIFVYGDLLYVPIDNFAWVMDKRTGRLRKDIVGEGDVGRQDSPKIEKKAGAVYTGSPDLGHNAWGFLPWKWKGEDVFLGRRNLIRAKDGSSILKVEGFGPHAACVVREDRAFSSKCNYGGKQGSYEWLLQEKDGALKAQMVRYHLHEVSWWSVGEGHGWALTTRSTPRMNLVKWGGGPETALELGFMRGEKNRFGRAAWQDDRYPGINNPIVAGKYAFGTLWCGQTVVVDLAQDPPKAVSFNVTEPCYGSYPFFQGNRMYLRAGLHLYCIGAPGAAWAPPKVYPLPAALPDLSQEDAAALVKRLESRRPAERLAAAEALAGKKGDPAAILKALKAEDHEEAMEALARALGASGGAAALPELLGAPDPRLRVATLKALGGFGAAAVAHLDALLAAPAVGQDWHLDRARMERALQDAIVALGPGAAQTVAAKARELTAKLRDGDDKVRARSAAVLGAVFRGLGGLGEAGKAGVPAIAGFLHGVMDPDNPREDAWQWPVFAAALPALVKLDKAQGQKLVRRFIEHLAADRVGRWPSRDHIIMALDACDAETAPLLVPFWLKRCDWGKDIVLASALVNLMLRADAEIVKGEVLPNLKGHLDGSLKEDNKPKLGCAIWAYYKAGGERKPLDWKPSWRGGP